MRILLLADIHIGSIKDTGYMYNVLRDIIDEEIAYKKTDLVVILGDYFDKLFKTNEEYTSLAINTMSHLIRTCKRSNTKIRMVYGTESHEMNQYNVFNYHLTSSDVDIKIFSTVTEEETFPGVNILYIPEEYINDKHKHYKKHLYSGKKYDYIFGHGVIVDGMPKNISLDNASSKSLEKQVPRFKSGEFTNIAGTTVFGHYHCVPINTEVLTRRGYFTIDKLDYNSEIACYNNETKFIEFHKPKNILIRNMYEHEKMYSIFSPPGGEQYKRSTAPLYYKQAGRYEILMTERHRSLYKNQPVETSDLPDEFRFSDISPIPAGISLNETTENYSPDQVRLIAWIVGDGTFELDQMGKTRIRFHLSKERKIERLKNILNRMHILYSEHVQCTGNTKINLIGATQQEVLQLFDNIKYKTYPRDFMLLSKDLVDVLYQELIHIDGDYEMYIKTGRYRMNSCKSLEIDMLSGIFIMNGYQHTVHRRRPKHYKENFQDHQYIDMNIDDKYLIKREVDYSDKVGCVSVPTGYFIMKQNGIPMVTGNCYTDIGNGVYYLGSLFRDKFGEEIPKGYGVIEDEKLTFIENKQAYIYDTYEFDSSSDVYESSDNILKVIDTIKRENQEIFSGEKEGRIRIIFKTPMNIDPSFRENLKGVLFNDKIIAPLIKESNDEFIEEVKDDIDDELEFILDPSLKYIDKIHMFMDKQLGYHMSMEKLTKYLEGII